MTTMQKRWKDEGDPFVRLPPQWPYSRDPDTFLAQIDGAENLPWFLTQPVADRMPQGLRNRLRKRGFLTLLES